MFKKILKKKFTLRKLFMVIAMIAVLTGMPLPELTEPGEKAWADMVNEGEKLVWNFDVDNDTEGWGDEAQAFASPVVAGGVLRSSVTGFDPFLSGPEISADAGRFKTVEIRLKASAGKKAWVYFRTSESPEFGSLEKHVAFRLTSDDQFHDYVIDMSTHGSWKENILQLRIDIEPPDVPVGTQVEIDYIRLGAINIQADEGEKLAWNFDVENDAEGWGDEAQAFAPPVVAGGLLTSSVTGFDPFLAGADIAADGSKFKTVEIRLKASAGEEIWVYFRTSESPGFGSPDKHVAFRLTSDNQFHDYVVDMSTHGNWKGNILQLRVDIEPPDVPAGTHLEIDYIRLRE